MDFVETHGLSVDVLINNAGLSGNGAFTDAPWSIHDAEIQLMIGTVTEFC